MRELAVKRVSLKLVPKSLHKIFCLSVEAFSFSTGTSNLGVNKEAAKWGLGEIYQFWCLFGALFF